MYRCENCGHLFADGEHSTWIECHGEEWAGCPVCCGDYEEVHQCQECDEWHADDELYEGWCEECLRETINYDTFFEYCEANISENYLDSFVMREFLNMEIPDHSSFAFHSLMIRLYSERVQAIKSDIGLFGKSHVEFLDACIRFIMDDDGSNGRDDYADWLNKREVK